MQTKRLIVKAGNSGFISPHIICLLLFTSIILLSSMSFWNVLKIRNVLLSSVRKSRAIWKLEENATSYQTITFFNGVLDGSICKSEEGKAGKIMLLNCKDESHEISKKFVLVYDDE
jgi:hypothetical protein